MDKKFMDAMEKAENLIKALLEPDDAWKILNTISDMADQYKALKEKYCKLDEELKRKEKRFMDQDAKVCMLTQMVKVAIGEVGDYL